MHALFFEVRPKPGHREHYFEHAARLRPVLARHTGLAFLDRYASLSEPDLLLSHQLWENEEAITAWRNDAEHRRSQAAGRRIHFADYRIRVGARVRHWQAGAPDTTVRTEGAPDAPHVIALYGTRPVTAPGFATFESVNREGSYIALATLEGSEAARIALESMLGTDGLEQAAAYCISRDYGQFDRAQVPR